MLEELAFMRSYSRLDAATKPVSNHGQGGFNYIYYESWPVFEKLVNGAYGVPTSEEVGYVVAKVISEE